MACALLPFLICTLGGIWRDLYADMYTTTNLLPEVLSDRLYRCHWERRGALLQNVHYIKLHHDAVRWAANV